MNTHDKYELPPLPEPGEAMSKWAYDEQDMKDYARAAIESYAKRIAELEAARIAYASEFKPDENGEPDVGRIHENIRKLKADRKRQNICSHKERVALEHDIGTEALQELDRKRGGEPVAWCVQNPNGEGVLICGNGLALKPGDQLYLPPQPAEHNDWKQAVDDELTSIHYTADSFPSAKEAVKALLDWHVSVATDPAFQPAEPSDPVKDAVEEDNRRAAEQACNVLALRLGYVWNGEDWIEHKPAELVKDGRVGEMTPKRAAFFLERFKREEKLLGPNEQWALEYAIEVLEAEPVKKVGDEEFIREIIGASQFAPAEHYAGVEKRVRALLARYGNQESSNG